VTTPIVWAICLPFAGGALAFLLGRRFVATIGLITSLGTAVAAVALARQVWHDGVTRYAIGGWGAPLGIDFRLDGLSALMVLVTATVGVFVSVYSLGYFPSEFGDTTWRERDGFWPLWLLLWGSLNALFLSADVFNYYVGLELITLAAIALIILTREPTALAAAMRYLMAAFLGSLSYLLGVALLYAAYDVLDVQALAERVSPGPVAWIAMTLMTLGLLVKTALFPLHFWLPRAHASAPAPVSAVLSALVVKASFYLLLRLWFEVFAEAITFSAGQLLGVLGTAAIVWGSLQAIRQQRLKLLIAHSTVAQIGYLFLLIPLVMTPLSAGTVSTEIMIASNLAWNGGIYHIVAHACAKAAMFMAAGTFMYALGNDRLDSMRGVAECLPMTTFAFGLAGISLMGLPPSGGFVSKWLLVNAAIASGQWWWALVLVVGGLLAAGYVFVVLRQVSLAMDESCAIKPVPRVLEVTTMALAIIALLLGLRASEPLALLQIGSPFPAPVLVGR
jgi:multicomponent Na+:H+ antiporter subunit D